MAGIAEVRSPGQHPAVLSAALGRVKEQVPRFWYPQQAPADSGRQQVTVAV
jgi:hypothetical protein